MEDKKYCYCKIKIEDRRNSLYYINELENLKLGDIVEVPFGYENDLMQGTVVDMKNYSIDEVPYDVEKTKKIIRILDKDKLDIIEGNIRLDNTKTKLIKYVGDMNNLKSYTIPSNIIEIAPKAFSGARNLEKIELNEGLKIIGKEAFYNTSIKKVKIPSTIEEIGTQAFTHKSSCHSEYSIDKKNRIFRTDKNCLYKMNEDGTDTLLACWKIGLALITIPDEVIEIGEKAFVGCSRLKEIDLNNNLQIIGPSAFDKCPLDKIFLPENIKEINDLAFKECETKNYRTYRVNIEISPQNNNYVIEDKILYKKLDDDSYEVICCNSGKNKIIVKPNTKIIKESAFEYCKKLKTIILPPTLEKIEQYAFIGCENLGTVTIDNDACRNLEDVVYLPEKIKKIELRTFQDCGFKKIKFSDGIEFINSSAFSGCDNLKSVILPKNLKQFCNAYDYASELEKIEISEENEFYCTQDGILFDKKQENILFVPQAYKSNCYKIPDSVLNIGTSFADCTNIKKIIINKNITSLEAGAFAYSKITEFEIPANVTSVGKDAFLLSYDVKGCQIIGEKGSYIENYVIKRQKVRNLRIPIAFWTNEISPELLEIRANYLYEINEDGVTILKSLKDQKTIVVPPVIERKNVIEIGKEAFKDNKKLEKIILPATLEKIGAYAFENCENLTNITIPDFVEEIGPAAFYYCTNLKTIHLPSHLKVISRNLFLYDQNLMEIKIPNNVTEIEYGAFFGCEPLRIYIPSSVKKISDELFTYCGSSDKKEKPDYKDLYISKPIKFFVEKESYADQFVQEYKSKAEISQKDYFNLVYDEKNTLTIEEEIDLSRFEYRLNKESNSEDDNCFESYYISGISRPDQKNRVIFPNIINGKPVTKIDINYYYGAPIDEIVISENIKTIEKMPRINQKITVSEKNPYFTTDGITLFSKDMTKLIRVYVRNLTNYIIPDSVTEIGENAFAYCDKITEITIPSNVKIIKDKAFLECEKLNTVNGCENIESVGNDAFKSTPWFNNQNMIILGSTLIKCNLTTEIITIPDGIKTISNNALALSRYDWNTNDKTKQIILPDSIENIGDLAFAYRRKLEQINIPNKVTTLSMGLFKNCESLKEIIIPDNITSIESGVFADCKNLSKVKLPDNLSIIPNQLFYNCENLEEIIIPNSVSIIESSAFNNCQKLKTIKLPPYLKEIPSSLFEKCTSLENIEMPSSVEKIGYHAFYYCENLTEITLPESLKELGEEAFSGCSSLTKLFIPKTVEKLKNTAFPHQPKFSYFTKGKSKACSFSEIEVDKENPYYSSNDGILFTKDLKRLIYVPTNYKETTYTIPEQTEVIESNAFKENNSIKKLIFPDTVKIIEKSACSSCQKLEEVILPKDMEKIPASLFEYCHKLRKVQWPENLNEIGDSAFAVTNLKELNFPSTVTTIKDYAFAHLKTNKITLPKTVKNIGLSIFAGVQEIEVYDSVDEKAKLATEYLDDCNGTPNSNVGWMGILKNRGYTTCAASPNSTWYNHTIIVRSSKTTEIKYKVPMLGINEPRSIYCMLSSSWGKNAEFNFNKLDKDFKNMKNMDYKVKIAISRLEDNYNLNEETKEMYQSYLKKTGLKMVNRLIEEDDMEGIISIIKYDVITKSNIDKAITYANELKKTNILSYLLNYKNEMKK